MRLECCDVYNGTLRSIIVRFALSDFLIAVIQTKTWKNNGDKIRQYIQQSVNQKLIISAAMEHYAQMKINEEECKILAYSLPLLSKNV